MVSVDPSMHSLFQLLSELLSALTCNDNAQRAQAEAQLSSHWTATQPQILLSGLSWLLANSPDSSIRSFSAVLLRRIALQPPASAQSDTPLISLQEESVISFIMSNLLQSLENELEPSVRLKVGDTITEIADHIFSNNGTWPNLPETVVQCATSQNSHQRSSAFQIIAGLSSIFVRENPAALSSLFETGIQDPEIPVRLAALKATVYTMLEVEPQIQARMAPLVTPLLNIIPPLINDSSTEDQATEALGYLIELAESFPKLFKPVLPNLISFMTSMMQNTSLDDSTRQTCLELLLTLTETAPGMMRKHANYAATVIPIMLEWMSEIDDDPEWYTTEDLEDDDNESNETVGEQGMDRIARFLGGKTVLPVAFAVIPNLLSSPDWQKRHAGLRSISAIGEGCHKIMSKELEKVIGIVLPHFRDPHPRVRHAACNAIGQMCTDFAPEIQNKFHEAILSHMVPVMDDVQFIRVQTYAAAALVNFSENCPTDCIAPYLDAIIPKLLTLLNSGKMYSQEQAITTLATVADSASDQFIKYYSHIMPVLINILQMTTQKEFRSLRGKTLECATLVAMAVGKETFGQHAIEFIEILKQTQASIVDADDPQASYLLSAWARVCKVLGADFAPYLEIVLPPLLAAAQLKPDIATFDSDEEVGEQYNEDEGWEIVQLRGQKIGIKTSLLDEKCTAIEMLLCYAQEMGALFHPHVEQIINIVVPLLKFYLHDGVRYAAAAVIPLLLSSWVKAEYPREKVLTLWHAIAQQLFESLHTEADPTLIGQIFNTFYECLKNMGHMSLTPELLTRLTTETQTQLKEYFERLKIRQESRNDPDYDPEDEQALQDDEYSDETLLSEISRVIHELFKNHRGAYLPYFEQLLPAIDAFMDSADPAAKQWAICVYDDLIEFIGPDSLRYKDRFLQKMIACLSSDAADVRQAAAYGIGIAGKVGGAEYVPICVSALPILFGMISAADSRSEENMAATENAISAIGKISKTMGPSGAFDNDGVINMWIKSLPILEDDEEAPECYSYLLELADASHPSLVSNDPNVISHLVSILTQVLVTPGLLDKPDHEALKTRMVDLLRRVLSGCDDALRGQLWNGMSSDTKKRLSQKGYI